MQNLYIGSLEWGEDHIEAKCESANHANMGGNMYQFEKKLVTKQLNLGL